MDSTSGFQVLDANGGTSILSVDTTNERVGIGVSNPSYTLDVTGTANDASSGRVVHIDSTLASSTNTQVGLFAEATFTPTGASGLYPSASYSFLSSSATDVTGVTLSGAKDWARYSGTGTAGTLNGVFGRTQLTGTGSISTANAGFFQNQFTAAGTVTNSRGVTISAPLNTGSATITSNTGLYVGNQNTSATTDYGIYIADADNYSLYLASVDGDAASGITFGADTNLYRSAANTLFTDDNLTVALDLAVNGGDLTLGVASTTNGTIVLENSTNAFAVTIDAPNQLTGTATISLPNTAGVSDSFCLSTLGNCSSGSTTLQSHRRKRHRHNPSQYYN